MSPQLLWGLAWALVALVLTAYAFKRLYPGDLVNPDAMDLGQIARNIAEGHGFATGILRPLALSGFVSADKNTFTTPDISHAPLYPFILMLTFVVHGGHGGGNVVVLTSLLFFLASAAAVYALAKTLFPSEGQPWLALLSVGLYLLSGSALNYAVAGLPVSLVTFLLCLFLIAAFRSHEAAGRATSAFQVFGVGLLLGLCYLAQYSLLLLLVPTLIYVFATRAPSRAWGGVGLCLAGFLLVSLPWLVRMAIVSHGNPFFTLFQYGVMTDTAEYPGQSSIYRSVMPDQTPFSFFFSHLPEMIRKAGRSLDTYEGGLTQAFPVLILAPALASLLWRFPDVRVGILRGYVAISLLLIAVVTAFFTPSVQLLAPFAPVVIVIGAGFVFQLMARQQWQPLPQRIALWSWVLLVGIGLFGVLVGREAPTLNPVQKGLDRLAHFNDSFVSKETPPSKGGALPAVITDMPWEVAWRLGNPAIWLPQDNQAYDMIVQKRPNIVQKTPDEVKTIPAPAMLLTPTITAYNGDGEASSWLALAREPNVVADQPVKLQQQYQIIKQAVAQESALIAVGKGQMTSAELQQRAAAAKQAAPGQIRQAYSDTFGPISEIVADYQPEIPQIELDGAPSTLFVRHDYLKSISQNTAGTP